MVKVGSLSHVGLWVRDLDRSIRWYEEMLGFVLTERLGVNTIEPAAPHGIAWLRCSAEHHNLVLIQLPPEQAGEPMPYAGKGTLQQMAFEVESIEALHAAHEFLARKGAKILIPPVRQKQSPGWKFYFTDPDGHKLEIYSGMKRVEPGYGRHYGKWPEGAG
ncbi:MAG: VOC family protein [Candidatus Tectomicrobia bacterium]|nr:VOC family protein [Candidatus Tectomicrobia bacterium]